MAEHKFTDEELQKCIECCIKAETWGDCETMACPASTRHGCRFYLRTDDDYENTIYIEILKDVLDLINRQKAEVAKEVVRRDLQNNRRMPQRNVDLSANQRACGQARERR